jgi:hypothetical protein
VAAVDILELIARSEWPVVVGGALLLFRHTIRDLIARINLTKIDAWGLKAEFEKGLDKVDALTPPKEEKPAPKVAMDQKTPVDAIHDRAEGSPSPEATVLDTWSWLEGDMRAMIDVIHPRNVGGLWTPPLKIEEAARELGLSDDEVESLLTLRKLRNNIAHSAERSINWEDALRFREAALRLLGKMKRDWGLRSKPNPLAKVRHDFAANERSVRRLKQWLPVGHVELLDFLVGERAVVDTNVVDCPAHKAACVTAHAAKTCRIACYRINCISYAA